ncbi:hypothetical protein [Halobacillus salinus]|uniref:hypothetical protein n=1 Tax=Halobacillus salinus TaxID=192814 RepID=UPI00159239A9|nr:hypothetical protein [Halobacillus salinus]
MYLAITVIALALLILLVVLNRKQLFGDEKNAKLLIVIFVFLPLVVIAIVVAALGN